jgi:hypothetical protein
MNNKYYVLRGKTPVQVDLLTWGRWFEDIKKRRIAFTQITADIFVSTIFLGIDHSFGDTHLPILFETMIMGDGSDTQQWRCAFYNQALKQHTNAVKIAKRLARQVADIAKTAGAKTP